MAVCASPLCRSVRVARSAASAPREGGATVEFVNCVRAFETEFDYVYRALKRHGVNPADAEDLAQEVFLVMWRRWADYDTTRPLRPWLAGIAFKVAHDYRRRSGREVPGGLVDAEDQAPGAEEHLASARARTLVLRALGSLPEKQRTIIVMHDLDGASMREIADILSVPLFTAYSRLRSARQAFAKSVRRLHTLAMATAGLDRLPSPQMLLRTERVPPTAPNGTRRRVISRAKALGLMPLPPQEPRATVQPAKGTRALPFALGGGLLLALGALVATTRPWVGSGERGGAAAAHHASTLPARLGKPTRPEVAAALSRELIGYWRLDESGDAAVVHDRSGKGNDCPVLQIDAAAHRTDGVMGGALTFDGGTWVTCGRPDSWAALSTEISIAGWIKRTRAERGLRALVSRQQGRDNQDFFILGVAGERLVFSSTPWDVKVVHTLSDDLGRWLHVAFTRADDGTAVLYVDGREASRVIKPRATSIEGGDNALIIGGGVNVPDPERPTELFEGAIDELMVYGRALTAEEVSALANGTEPKVGI
jgi:RNA polymerase sigma factor (sigma-70 family)